MKSYPLYPVDLYDTFQSFVKGIGKKYEASPAVTLYTRGTEAFTKTYGDLFQDVRALSVSLRRHGWAQSMQRLQEKTATNGL